MASLFDRLRNLSPSLKSGGGDEAGWVQPGNAVTRAVLAADTQVPETPAGPPPEVAIPAETLARIEAVTAEDEAAADAYEAARRAALGLPPEAPSVAAEGPAPAASGDQPEGHPKDGSGNSAEAA